MAVVGANLAVISLEINKMIEIKQGTLFGFDLVLKVDKRLHEKEKEIINENTLKNHIKDEVMRAGFTNKRIGNLRQWLNEDRITDVNKMVTNEQLILMLFSE